MFKGKGWVRNIRFTGIQGLGDSGGGNRIKGFKDSGKQIKGFKRLGIRNIEEGE